MRSPRFTPGCLLSASVLSLPLAVMAEAQHPQPATEAPPLIPRDVLFGNPDRAGVQISPDGTRLSYLAPLEGVLNVWVKTIGQDDGRAVTRAAERPIRTYFWAENGEQIIYQQDSGGDENFHLFAVDMADGAERDLTPFENVQARVLATDRQFPDEILASINNRIPQVHDVYRINTRTGESELVEQNDQFYIGYLADSDFNVRLAMRMDPDGGMSVFYRDAGAVEWAALMKIAMSDTLNSSPVGFSRDGQSLYVLDASGVDKAGLYRYDLTQGTDARELVFQSDQADLSSAMIDPDTGHPQAVAVEYLRTEWQVLDPALKKDWEALSRIEDGDFNIISRDHDDDTWAVAYTVDDGPVKYYLYERANQASTFLFTNRTALEAVVLAKMRPVEIPSRDGLTLVSYLTTPVGVAPRNLPMVLLVHGGPWARDSWGYNPIHQWLANRGYAVLSVNFRGSTGFGKAFINAANREWAAKMHDDLIDAVNWAVEQGVADRERVAIMGGSYGGYATLVGLTYTPEVFAAGVDIVGPSHIRTLLESIPPYWAPMKTMFETRVGALSEPEYLDSISPLTKVDAIQKPLLIGQGANDPRVKQAESEQIVKAMQERYIPVTYVLFPDEGHGFARPENSMAFFAVTENFLSQHLGGRSQAIGDDVAVSSAQVPEGAALVPGLGSSEKD